MADYNLGTAFGRILLEYDDKGVSRAEKALEGVKTAHEMVGRSSDKMGDDSERNEGRVGKALRSVAKHFITAAAGATAAGTTIGAASAVIGSLASNTLTLAGSLVPAVGALGLLPAAGAVAATGLVAVKVATSGMSDAIKAAVTDPEKLAKAMEKLSPEAKKVVQEVVKLRPQLKALKTEVQDSMFHGLNTDLAALAGQYLPIVQSTLARVAVGFNQAAHEVAAFMLQANTVSTMKTMGTDIANVWLHLTSALKPIVSILVDIAAVGMPMLSAMTAGIGQTTAGWAAFISQARQTGQLAGWIQTGLSVLQQLGFVVVQVAGIFQALWSAANQAGGSTIATLGQALLAVNRFLSAGQGMQMMVTYFSSMNQAIANAMPFIRALGDVIVTYIMPAISQLAPMIGTAFAALAPALQPLGEMIKALVPIVGQLAIAFATSLAHAIQVAAPIVTFLANTLRNYPGLFVAIISAAAGLFGIFMNIGTILGAIGKIVLFKALLNALGATSVAGRLLQTVFSVLGGGASTLLRVFTFMTGPIGILVGIFILLFTTSDQFRGAIMNLIGVLGGALMSIFQALMPLIMMLVNTFSMLVSTIVGALMPVFTILAGAIAQVINAIAPLITQIVAAFMPAITALVNVLVAILGPALSILVPIIQVLGVILAFVANIIATVLVVAVQILVTVISFVISIIAAFVQAVVTGIGMAIAFAISVITNFGAIWNAVWGAITGVVMTVLTAVWNFIVTVMTAIWTVISTVLMTIFNIWWTIWSPFFDVISAIWSVIIGYISIAMSFIGSLIMAGLSAIAAAWSAIWNAVSAVASAVWNAIWGVIGPYMRMIGAAIQAGLAAISAAWNTIWNAIKAITGAVWNWIQTTIISRITACASAVGDGWAKIWGFFQRGVEVIKGIVSGFGHLLLDAGRALMEGLLNGIKAAWEKVAGFLHGLADKIRALKGPYSYDKKILIKNGMGIMLGLKKGLQDGFKDVARFASSIAPDLASRISAGATATVGLQTSGAGDMPGANGTANGGSQLSGTRLATPTGQTRIDRGTSAGGEAGSGATYNVTQNIQPREQQSEEAIAAGSLRQFAFAVRTSV